MRFGCDSRPVTFFGVVADAGMRMTEDCIIWVQLPATPYKNRKMTYERYRIIKSKKEFFAEWNKDQLVELNEIYKNKIYKGFVFRCQLFQRANFKCQNETCTTPHSKLTKHHIIPQEHGGKDTMENCIMICDRCHKAYHARKNTLTFWGSTHGMIKEKKIDWKIIKKKSKKIRKLNKESCGITISWDLYKLLMKWLDTSKYEK